MKQSETMFLDVLLRFNREEWKIGGHAIIRMNE